MRGIRQSLIKFSHSRGEAHTIAMSPFPIVRLQPKSDIEVTNKSIWNCKNSHNAAPRSGAAASCQAH